MAVKFSKMSAFRIDLAHNLEAGLTNYQQALAGGYVDFATPLLEDGETAPDISFQVELMKRGIARGRQRLQTFDGGVVEQVHEDEKVRSEIDLHNEAVAAKMRRVRHICRGFYGQKGVERVGLRDEPARGSADLYQQGKVVKASLETDSLGLKQLLVIETGEGVDPPSKQMAAQLEPELSALGELVTGRHQENRKAADLRSRRRQALEEFDRDIRAIVRTAQGMFRLAGRDDLANRFRPILRRVLRRLDKAQAEEAKAEAATAEGTAAEATAETATPDKADPAEATQATP